MRICLNNIDKASCLDITKQNNRYRVEYSDIKTTKVILTEEIESIVNDAIDDGYRFLVIE